MIGARAFRRLARWLGPADATPAAELPAPDRDLPPPAEELPAPATEPRPDVRVRLDGLYVRAGSRYTGYLRFRGSGTCHSVSSTGSPEQVARWLGAPDRDDEQCGPFTIAGDRITIDTRSSYGRVHYAGTVGESALDLHLCTHSLINGYRASGVWRFHAVRFPDG